MIAREGKSRRGTQLARVNIQADKATAQEKSPHSRGIADQNHSGSEWWGNDARVSMIEKWRVGNQLRNANSLRREIGSSWRKSNASLQQYF
jgi:hypothetical protein